MFLLFALLFPLVAGEQFLSFHEKDLNREMPLCQVKGVLSCQKVSFSLNLSHFNFLFDMHVVVWMPASFD
jgi:hypothetical protein